MLIYREPTETERRRLTGSAMVARLNGSLLPLVVVGALTGADAAAQGAPSTPRPQAEPATAETAGAAGPERSHLGRAEAMIMLDYQVIPVPQEPAIDLMGFHVLNQLTDWMYVGVGAYAPLVRGDYGGFMAFDVTAHAQRRIWGNLFADAGLALGGGGGGKSKEQSPILSGTGGFVKAYVGLGYGFKDFSVGANVAMMKFNQSTIDHTQLNLFLQVPFSYAVGPYASSGERLSDQDAKEFLGSASENTLTLGLDDFSQIDPQGSNKSTIRLADLQFSHYMTRSTYWYASAGVGYSGLRLYNQLLGGLGYRFKASPRVDLYAQLGLGSGGWAPDTIDTGAGLLVYPKVSAEYAIDRHFGIALTAGYMFAPTGSSKNYTYGASLSYHIHSDRGRPNGSESSGGPIYRGYRFSLFPQTEYHIKAQDADRANIRMLSVQLDTIASDHVYIPIQVAVAYNEYLGYPGYGELLAGIGVQNGHRKDDRFQFFGQLLGGTNAHGAVLKPGIGMNFGLSDRLAIYAVAGRTLAMSRKDVNFDSDYVGLGLTYRFSVPNW